MAYSVELTLCGHLVGTVSAGVTSKWLIAGAFGGCHLSRPVGGAAKRILNRDQ